MSRSFERKIFLSYRNADRASEVIIRTLCDCLERSYGKGRVFFDQTGLFPGDQWDPEIRNHLRECDAVVVLIGDVDRWLGVREDGTRRIDEGDDDWVFWEVKTALEEAAKSDEEKSANRKLVLPLLVTPESRLPTDAELPDELARLLECQKHTLGSAQEGDLAWHLDGFCRLLALQLPLSRERVALVDRLELPLKECGAVALAQSASLKFWWPLFWTALGVLPEEERDEICRMVKDRRAMLEYLATIPKNLPMLRFLLMVILRTKLPDAVRESWDQSVAAACESPDQNGWDLDAADLEVLVAEVEAKDLAPRLLIHFEERCDDRARHRQFAVSGTLEFGWDRRRLKLEEAQESWDGSKPGRDRALGALIGRLWQAVNGLVGAVGESEPRLELFLEPEQMDWRWESLSVPGQTEPVGQLFRIVRRLYPRHFEGNPKSHSPWKQRTEWYRNAGTDGRVDRCLQLKAWRELQEVGGQWAFATQQCWCPEAQEQTVLMGMVEGVWPRQSDGILNLEQIEAVILCDECSADVITRNRINPAWNDVVLLEDPHELPPPYNPRKPEAPMLDELPIAL